MEQNTKIKSNPLDHMRPDYMRKERRKIREGEGRNEEGRRRRRKGWTAASWAVRGNGLGGGDGQWVTHSWPSFGRPTPAPTTLFFDSFLWVLLWWV
jgi:hypothetical protein